MGIMNWFRKKKEVETTYEEAEQAVDDGTVLQENPFPMIKEEGGCCGGGGCGSHEQESSEEGYGSGGCGSESSGGGCCSTESAPMLSSVTVQTTLREAGQNPVALEIMLKNALPFGCGMKHLSIQEAGKSAGLNAVKIKKVVDEINKKIGKDSKQMKKSRAPAGGKTTKKGKQ